MEHRADAVEVALPRRHTLRIRDGEGLIFEVVEGCLWITQDQDCQDYIANAGQSLAIERGGLTLATACSATRMRLRKSGAACTPVIDLDADSAACARDRHPSLSAVEYLRRVAAGLVRIISAATPAPGKLVLTRTIAVSSRLCTKRPCPPRHSRSAFAPAPTA